MRKRTSVRGLVLATVNVVVILAAALIVKSLAAGNPGPGSSSFALPTDSKYALLSGNDNRPFTSGASAAFAPAASPSASAEDPSGHVVSSFPSEPPEYPAIGDLEFDPLWYGQSRSAFAPLVTDSGSWAQSGASLGYGSSSGATASRRRSGWGAGGFAGAGGGGGFPSSGRGTPSNAQNSLLDSSNNGGGLWSSDGSTASVAGAPLLPAQGQGNPFFAGGIPVGGPPFLRLQFPNGAGAAVALNAGGSTASVVQLQEPVSVPEPSTVLLLGCGLALAAYRRRVG